MVDSATILLAPCRPAPAPGFFQDRRPSQQIRGPPANTRQDPTSKLVPTNIPPANQHLAECCAALKHGNASVRQSDSGERRTVSVWHSSCARLRARPRSDDAIPQDPVLDPGRGARGHLCRCQLGGREPDPVGRSSGDDQIAVPAAPRLARRLASDLAGHARKLVAGERRLAVETQSRAVPPPPPAPNSDEGSLR